MAEKSKPQEEAPKRSKKPLIALLLLGIGGWYFFTNYEVINKDGQVTIKSKGSGVQGSTDPGPVKPNIKMPPLRKGRGDQIHIATFNVGPLDARKLSSEAIVSQLAATIRNFDIVALQDIQVQDPGKLDLLTKKLASRGRHYEYVVSPDQATYQGAFNAFLFDRASVEVDRDHVFSLNDPNGRLRVKPLSALFRVRGPAKDQAFTFVAINVHINPNERESELPLLPNVLDTVKKNYPDEDDLILLASLQTSPADFGALGDVPGITYAVSNTPNMVQSNYLADNILFDRRATIEYGGESGVYDLARRLKLTPEQTIEVTRHLPVWAKFSIYEGGRFIK